MFTKKISIIVIITFFLLVSFFIGLYMVGLKAAPYNVAIKYIINNSDILVHVGKLNNIRLAFFGYSVRYDGPHGYAEYEIIIKGEKANGKVYVNMEKTVGVWGVVKANLALDGGETVLLK